MGELLGFGIFIILVGYVVLRSVRKYRHDKKHRETLPDNIPIQEEINQTEYNGHPIYLSPAEQSSWDSMSRSNKRLVYRNQVKMLKKGIVVKVTDQNGRTGLITRAEAKQKGIIK